MSETTTDILLCYNAHTFLRHHSDHSQAIMSSTKKLYKNDVEIQNGLNKLLPLGCPILGMIYRYYTTQDSV
jgi:hypothetical protein